LSVEHLQGLYSIMVAIAMGFAFQRMITSSSKATEILLLASLIVTLIPFYHGTLRHLDDTYVLAHVDRGRGVLAEFAVRFLESSLFLGLAATIREPVPFACVYLALLTVNIGWSLLTEALCEYRAGGPTTAWRAINAGATAATVATLLFVERAGSEVSGSLALPIGLAAIAVGRTLADYGSAGDFYIGGPQEVRDDRKLTISDAAAPALGSF
jgi:hypothetical protein